MMQAGFFKKSLLALLAFGAVGMVSAQFSGLPQCGATCASEAAGNDPACSSGDMRCLCNSNAFVDSVYGCTATACDFADQNSSIGHLGQICEEANSAPAPTSSGASSTGASSTPGSSSTSTSSGASTTPTSSGDTSSSTSSSESSSSGSGSSSSTPSTSGTPSTTATRSFTTSAAAGAGTTPAPGAAGSRSTSTQVVTQTRGPNGEVVGTGATSEGGVILNDNAAVTVRGVGVGVVVGAAGLVGVVMGL